MILSIPNMSGADMSWLVDIIEGDRSFTILHQKDVDSLTMIYMYMYM